MSSIGRRQWIQFAAGAAAAARNDRVEIANGRLRARFTRQAGGVAQEYFAKAAGGAWVLVLKSLHPPSPRPAGTAPLYGDVEVANEHRVLAGSALESVRLRDNHAVLAGRTAGGHRIEQSVWLDEDHFRVEVQAEIAGHPPRIEYLLSSFTFEGGKPEVAHAPCMKRAPEDVIADRVFHSPALFLQKEAIFAALVPDLDLINSQVVYAKGARPLDGTRPFRLPVDENKISMPTALDLELKSGITASPVVSYGFIDFLTQQHMYWRHENAKGAYVRELASNRLRYGFDLFARADAPRHRGYVAVSRYLWRRYGSAYFLKPKPQAMPFDEYAKVCYPAAFAYTGNDLGRMAGTDQKKSTSELLPTWLEFEFDGQPA